MADETPDGPEAPAGTGPAAEGRDATPDLEEAQACIGAKLDELGGTTVGRVDGLLLDATDGSPTWLTIRLGRFGRRAAIPFESVAAGVGHVWAPYPRETIRATSELDPSGGLSCADERELASHFGIAEGTGRLAAIGDRADDEPGSIPAQ